MLGVPNTEYAAHIAPTLGTPLYGLIHTTWHTLAKGMPYVLMAAVGCYEGREVKSVREFRTSAAALLRKVYRSNGVYERAGWTKYQINDRAWF